jgi:hypothetical protein
MRDKRISCLVTHDFVSLLSGCGFPVSYLGEQFTGVAMSVARVAGIALIALGIACWPGPPLVGMLSYSMVLTLYLAYLGIGTAGGNPPGELSVNP